MPDAALSPGSHAPAAQTAVLRAGGLYNAENVAMANGRAFVTGSKGVYEIVGDGRDCRLSEIPVRVDRPSDQWLRNGIASDGTRLYLACAHIHDSRIPFADGLFRNVPDIEQTLAGLSRVMLAELFCRVDTYILSADLESAAAELAFTDVLASSYGTFFGNGLDVAEDGTIYVANSYPGSSGGIYRIRPGAATLEFCHRCTGCSPNGLRVEGSNLYYTGLQIWPYPAAVLRQVDLAAADSSPGASRLLVARQASLFDDFDVLESGFVVAEFASWRQIPFGVGGLLFFSSAGDLLEELRADGLVHHSSVRASRKVGSVVATDELLVTEKSGHRVLAVRRGYAQRVDDRFSASIGA